MRKDPLQLTKLGKVLLCILCFLVLYGTLRPECRGWHIDTPPHCVD